MHLSLLTPIPLRHFSLLIIFSYSLRRPLTSDMSLRSWIRPPKIGRADSSMPTEFILKWLNSFFSMIGKHLIASAAAPDVMWMNEAHFPLQKFIVVVALHSSTRKPLEKIDFLPSLNSFEYLDLNVRLSSVYLWLTGIIWLETTGQRAHTHRWPYTWPQPHTFQRSCNLKHWQDKSSQRP